MNPWELLLALLGWLVFVLVALAAVVLVLAVAVGTWRGMRKWFPPKDKLTLMSQTLYLQEAKALAHSEYGEELLAPLALQEAFLAGARWGWGAHRRK